MSEIEVPDGMLKAALESQFKCWGYDPSLWTELHKKYESAGRLVLESALLWLRENPIVPSDDQVEDMSRRSNHLDGEFSAVRATMMEWPMRMFLAPDFVEDYADRILKNASPGYTPTHAELDKIWEYIFKAGHGWTPPEQRAEINIEKEIEDLFFRSDVEEKGRGMSGNERIKEAYRRGRVAK